MHLQTFRQRSRSTTMFIVGARRRSRQGNARSHQCIVNGFIHSMSTLPEFIDKLFGQVAVDLMHTGKSAIQCFFAVQDVEVGKCSLRKTSCLFGARSISIDQLNFLGKGNGNRGSHMVQSLEGCKGQRRNEAVHRLSEDL
ncbi:hypothetical protein J6590_010759 [Homalodisca vitripennis]|nr:hypothetical protein J6590_010759 [Homalodisca vitripennis]